MSKALIEACVASYTSAKAACLGGADRLELCAHLIIGGTTPSSFVFQKLKHEFDIDINVLIRPRFGDFLYSEVEMEQMCEEIRDFRSLGANAVVIGVLTPQGDLDIERMKRLIEAAGDMKITLHRAFDMCRDPFDSLEKAVRLGCSTILSSGQAADVEAGIPLLRQLYEKAAGRIDIMAGCGVKKWNIEKIHDETGITVFHTTGRKAAIDGGMLYRKEGVSMGLPGLSEYEIWETEEEEFRACADIVHRLKAKD